MQVVCTHCHAVCDVDADRFAAPSAGLTCDKCQAALALPAVEIGIETSWLVLMPHGQAGPYSAAQMAELIDHASIDWSSLVWRPGLKGWRPARRDPELVTSVASARGSSAFGDTQRVSVNQRSLLPATDTIVEPLQRVLARRASEGSPRYGSRGESRARAAPPAPAIVSERFASDSGEDFAQVTHRIAGPAPTLADALLGAASIVAAPEREPPAVTPDTQPVVARASSPHSWLPSMQSMLVVAIVAFGFGVLAAALWTRFFAKHEPRALAVEVRPPSLAPAQAQPPVARPVSSASLPPQLAVLEVRSLAPAPTDELPRESELRREVRRVSPDIRRCIDDLSRGAEVEIYFDGTDGRVRDLRLRTVGLSPGRVECITQAVRQMQVSPFRRPTHKFWHRFSY